MVPKWMARDEVRAAVKEAREDVGCKVAECPNGWGVLATIQDPDHPRKLTYWLIKDAHTGAGRMVGSFDSANAVVDYAVNAFPDDDFYSYRRKPVEGEL